MKTYEEMDELIEKEQSNYTPIILLKLINYHFESPNEEDIENQKNLTKRINTKHQTKILNYS